MEHLLVRTYSREPRYHCVAGMPALTAAIPDASLLRMGEFYSQPWQSCGKVITCDSSLQRSLYCWVLVCRWHRRLPPGRVSAITLTARRVSGRTSFSVPTVTTAPTSCSGPPTTTSPSQRSRDG